MLDHLFQLSAQFDAVQGARFNYSGDLLDIGNVLKSDYARFLKISKLETGQSDIELIQAFDNVHNLDSDYHIYAPITRLPADDF